jgi:hypothetical protein
LSLDNELIKSSCIDFKNFFGIQNVQNIGFVSVIAAKPDPFFPVQPNFWPNFWVQMGRVGPQDPKTGPIGSGWPLKGFKFGFNPIMSLINPISTRPCFGSGWPSGSKFGSNSGRVGRVHLAALSVLWVSKIFDETETRKMDPRRDQSRGLESRLQALIGSFTYICS